MLKCERGGLRVPVSGKLARLGCRESKGPRVAVERAVWGNPATVDLS